MASKIGGRLIHGIDLYSGKYGMLLFMCHHEVVETKFWRGVGGHRLDKELCTCPMFLRADYGFAVPGRSSWLRVSCLYIVPAAALSLLPQLPIGGKMETGTRTF